MLRFYTSGESHGEALTAVISGIPAGLAIDQAFIDRELWRRQQGFGRGGREGERELLADPSRDRVGQQILQRGVAQDIEHALLVGGGGTDVPRGERTFVRGCGEGGHREVRSRVRADTATVTGDCVPVCVS